MSLNNRQEILETLLGARNVLISAHIGPDGDSLGSQLALAGFLAERNINHTIVNDGLIPAKYDFLPGIGSVCLIDSYTPDTTPFDIAVIIECSNLDRIGRVTELIGPDCRIINIDHHQDNVPFGFLNWKEMTAAAAGEMIYDLLKESGHDITPDMAINLYTAILTDTGRFQYRSTTHHTMCVAGELLELGVDSDYVAKEVYYNMTPAMLKVRGLVLSDMEYLFDGQLCLMTLDRETMAAASASRGDTEGLVSSSLSARGVRVGILFTEIDETCTKVSFRSKNTIDVADIAAHFGGGGHKNASGCTVDMPLEKARADVIALVKGRLNGSV